MRLFSWPQVPSKQENNYEQGITSSESFSCIPLGHVVIDITAANNGSDDEGPRPSFDRSTIQSEDTIDEDDPDLELNRRLAIFNWRQSCITVLSPTLETSGQPTQIPLQLVDFIVFSQEDNSKTTDKDVYLLTFAPRRIPTTCPALTVNCSQCIYYTPLRKLNEKNNNGTVTTTTNTSKNITINTNCNDNKSKIEDIKSQRCETHKHGDLILVVHIEVTLDSGNRLCMLDQIVGVNQKEFRKVREKPCGKQEEEPVTMYRSRNKVPNNGITMYVLINEKDEIEKVVVKQKKLDFWAVVDPATC